MIKTPSQTIFYVIEKAIKEYRKFALVNLKEKVANITVDQALLLFFLNDKPELSQNEISKLVFKDKASVTRMIELMEKKNYLERSINKDDRRKFNLTLTAEGQKVLDEITPIISLNRKNALNGITIEEENQLNTILEKIISNCKNK